MLRAAVLSALLLALVAALPSSTTVVSNDAPRRDAATGEILDIHDGVTMRIDNLFYWFGASYGSCREMSSGCASIHVGACGFNLNHSVSLATSPDLVNWTLVGDVLPPANRPAGILFSPWVARSVSTGKYVMWFNILPTKDGVGEFDEAFYSVATSDTPEGPYTTVVVNVTGIAYTRLPDAPSIFVDTDGTGWIAFTHEDSHINNVQALTPDLLGPLPGSHVSAQIGSTNNEGVFMFKRNNLYYVGFGQCCCFCGEGSNVELWMATSPLGPYKPAGQLIAPSVWHAQTGGVWFTDGTGQDGGDFVIYADRWQSAPDALKSHDFSYMTPIDFEADGTVVPITTRSGSVTIRY